MKCFLINATFFIATFTNAQQQQVKPYLINVGTISPDAASLGRFGNIPVGYSTGLPGISIPVYEINVGKIKLPVSLDYHAGGIRVDEVSSSLGIGWALNCGGTITRNLAGFPDEDSWGFLSTNTPDPNLVNQNPQTYWKYLYDVTDGTADDTPDGFSYNFGNQNGKFTMKKGGGVFQIPVTNNRIESFYDTNGKMLFKITDDNGLVYLFKKIETYTFGSVNNQQLIGPYTNVWRITHIIDQNTIDTVFFNYEDACGGYGFEKIRSFSYELGTKPSGLTINDVNELSQNTQMNSYTPMYLISLTWRGGKIIFQNSCDRLDKVATEKRVTDISIYADDNGILSMIKKIKPFHSYFFNNSAAVAPFNFANSDERNYRLRLDSVGIFSSNLVDLPLKYRMTYDNTPMASRETYAQDAFGFNNGKFNNPNLLAKQLVQTGIVSSGAFNTKYLYIGDADRTADELYMKSCSITSISYPTGGRTEFELEPHQFSTGSFTRVTQSAYCAAAGGVQQSTSNTFVAGSDLENVRFNVFLPRYNYSSGVTGIPKVTLTDQTTGQEILGISNMTAAQDLSINLNALSLVAGHTYVMNVNIYTTTITAMQGSFQIFWEKPTSVMDIRKGGGLRVKTITDYSGSNTVSNKQVFNYGIGENGIGTMLTPYNYFSMNKKSIINRFGSPSLGPNGEWLLPCILTYGYDTKIYSSGSLNPISQFSGSPVLYTTVSKYEVDAANAKINGKSTFNYNVFQDMPGLAAPDIKNTTMIQLFPSSWKNGFLKEEAVYKSDGGGGFLLQEKKEYNYSESRTASINALKVVANYTDIGQCVTRLASGISADLSWALYPFNTGAYLLNSVVNTKNEGAGQLTTTESFLYNAPSHLFPTSQQTVNSKAETVIQNLKYPIDFLVAGNVFNKMVTRNIISPVIQNIKQLNGTQILLSNINYLDWQNNSNLLLPQNVELQVKTNSLETRMAYNGYDQYGNILEQQKTNDVKQSYIWDYKNRVAIAEATNASQSDIAYTSFESDGKGNWIFSGPTTPDITAPTGKKAYNLVAGNITKSISSVNTYIVSYWRPTSLLALTIAGTQAGYPIAGRTVNGWKYYEHRITGQTLATISGSGLIDELRLYPSLAQMTTYTYEALVGMSNKCDVNNRIIYYEYDAFNRLGLIRDQDRNILKKICYNYAGQPENCCTTTLPNWQNTAKPMQCQTNAGVNTGYQEQEQKDMNQCSGTYNTPRWITTAYNTTACPLPSVVSITSTNLVPASGFTAKFTNTTTNQIYTFNVSTNAGVQTLGSIPIGTYNIVISKAGNNIIYYFEGGCSFKTGTSATFNNQVITATTCKTVLIDYGL